MTMEQETAEKIQNIEKTLWGFRPVWLLTSVIGIVMATASVVLWFTKYDTEKNNKIDAVSASLSAKVDKLSQKVDIQHLRDSMAAVERYNSLYDAIVKKKLQKRVNPNLVQMGPTNPAIKGYTQRRDLNGMITYTPVFN